MENRRVKGSLQGIDGNAFMLMGYFQKLAKQQGFAKEWIQEVLDEAEILTSCQFLHSGVMVWIVWHSYHMIWQGANWLLCRK